MPKVLKCNDLSLIKYINNYLNSNGIATKLVIENDQYYLSSQYSQDEIEQKVQDALKGENIRRLKKDNGLSFCYENGNKKELLIPFAWDKPGSRPSNQEQYQGINKYTINGETVTYDNATGDYLLPADKIGSNYYFILCSELVKRMPDIIISGYNYSLFAAVSSLLSQNPAHVYEELTTQELEIVKNCHYFGTMVYIELNSDSISDLTNLSMSPTPKGPYSICEAVFAQMFSKALIDTLHSREIPRLSLKGLLEQINDVGNKKVIFNVGISMDTVKESEKYFLKNLLDSDFFAKIPCPVNFYTTSKLSDRNIYFNSRNIVIVHRDAWEKGELVNVASLTGLIGLNDIYKRATFPMVVENMDGILHFFVPKCNVQEALSVFSDIDLTHHNL